MAPKKEVIIVGSGIFGTSTGLALLEKGEFAVTIVDKADELPALDAASTDLNKARPKSRTPGAAQLKRIFCAQIIRCGDYADRAIANLSIEAVKQWRRPEWEGTYHETAVLMLATNDTPTEAYVTSSFHNVRSHGIPAVEVKDVPEIKAVYPSDFASSSKLAPFHNQRGYVNPHSGWAEAARAVEIGLRRFAQAGGSIRPGCEVVGVIEEGDAVKGVKLASGETLRADIVIVAAGAWTPALFAQEGMGGLSSVTATGQSVAWIQLSEQERLEYLDVPVVINLDTGFYCFPPNGDGLVKLAIHGAGVLNTSNPDNAASRNDTASQQQGISTPRTKLTPGAEDGAIPAPMVRDLRQNLALFYPELARKDFSGTRLCWYTDTPDGDWLIDWHPTKRNLFLATAGCGHAFKFLPNIGELIVAKIEGRLDPKLARKWRYSGRSAERDAATDSDVRGTSDRAMLNIADLATARDLKVPLPDAGRQEGVSTSA